jgi:hypothetical protein
MFGYELQKIRQAEMIRTADDHRLARQVRRARKEAQRQGQDPLEGRVSPLRHLFDSAA